VEIATTSGAVPLEGVGWCWGLLAVAEINLSHPLIFRRLQICSAVILVECGSPILPLHRNRLPPECPKEAFPLEINLYPWCSIF
jgi:hypothetical protein